jgi:hypothetical protein
MSSSRLQFFLSFIEAAVMTRLWTRALLGRVASPLPRLTALWLGRLATSWWLPNEDRLATSMPL